MKIKSLGYRTDLIFPRFDGVVRDRGDYIVVETPDNPHFHWGNFLLFKKEPQQGDLQEWTRTFKVEFGANPEIKHITFGWDTTQGEEGSVAEFLQAGFKGAQQVVLAATAGIAHRANGDVRAPKFLNQELEVRPLLSDLDWAQALENQVACRDPIHKIDSYIPFKEKQMRRYRLMQTQGLGFWFGAFIGEQLAGSLGVYCDGSVGRFQSVGTSPEFRRQGICGTMVYRASQFAFREMGLETLVMVADDDGEARRIYESVGFRPRELQSGVSWWQG